MPAIKVTAAKGLHQVSGTSTIPAGTLSGHRAVTEVITASKSLTAADSGKVFLIATDALVITLPATQTGIEYTFINSGADGNNIVTISPNASDAIHGTFTLASSVVELSGADNKDLIHTKATANTGDMAKIVGDGSGGWFVVAGTGIWASES